MKEDQNYIEVVKAVWKKYQSSILEPNDYCLMMRLIAISNDDMSWKNCFLRNNYELSGTTKLSMKQLTNSRNKLQQTGLISFEQRNGIANCKYEIHYDVILDLCKKSKGLGKVRERLGKGNGIHKLNNTTKLNNTSKSHCEPQAVSPEKDKTEYWKVLVDTWFDFYSKHFKTEEGNPKKPIFKGSQQKNLKDIIGELKKICIENKSDWTQENAVRYLERFFERAYNHDQWMKTNYELGNMLSKFNSITAKKQENGTITRPNTTGNNGVAGRQQSTVGGLLREFGKDIANADLQEYSEG